MAWLAGRPQGVAIPGTSASAQFPNRRTDYGRGGAVGAPVPLARKGGRSAPAIRRLLHDFKEIIEEPTPNIVACPLENDIFEWHCNLTCTHGKMRGLVLHLVLVFPDNYPTMPPRVKLAHTVPHPNVEGTNICVDLLKTNGYDIQVPYQGWSTAYGVQSILLQLYAFLFDENIPQGGCDTYYCCDWCCGAREMYEEVRNDKWQKNKEVTPEKLQALHAAAKAHQCKGCGHTLLKPWPAVSDMERATNEFKDKSGLSHRIMAVPSHIHERRRKKEEQKDGEKTQWDKMNESLTCAVFEFLLVDDLYALKCVCSFFARVLRDKRVTQRREVVCFHRKCGGEADVLGVGMLPEYYNSSRNNDRDGVNRALKSVTTFLDPLSYGAFREDNIRNSIWRQPFSHFLPLVLNEVHGRRAMPYIERTIAEIMGSGPRFEPEHALKLICAVMNTMVVNLMQDVVSDWDVLTNLDSRYKEVEEYTYDKFDRYKYELRTGLYHSEKAMKGYFAFHHILLTLVSKYPQVQVLADKKVRAFLKDPAARTKQYTPNLGEFLVMLSLSEHTWEDVADAVLEELSDRDVRWILQKCPHLAYDTNSGSVDCRRLSESFTATIVGKRLLMFQVYFLGLIGARYKRPKPAQAQAPAPESAQAQAAPAQAGSAGTPAVAPAAKPSTRPAQAQGDWKTVGPAPQQARAQQVSLPDTRPRLERYHRCLGLPPLADVLRLQEQCHWILTVTEWHQWYLMLGREPPSPVLMTSQCRNSLFNSERKRYHFAPQVGVTKAKPGDCICDAKECLYNRIPFQKEVERDRKVMGQYAHTKDIGSTPYKPSSSSSSSSSAAPRAAAIAAPSKPAAPAAPAAEKPAVGGSASTPVPAPSATPVSAPASMPPPSIMTKAAKLRDIIAEQKAEDDLEAERRRKQEEEDERIAEQQRIARQQQAEEMRARRLARQQGGPNPDAPRRNGQNGARPAPRGRPANGGGFGPREGSDRAQPSRSEPARGSSSRGRPNNQAQANTSSQSSQGSQRSRSQKSQPVQTAKKSENVSAKPLVLANPFALLSGDLSD